MGEKWLDFARTVSLRIVRVGALAAFASALGCESKADEHASSGNGGGANSSATPSSDSSDTSSSGSSRGGNGGTTSSSTVLGTTGFGTGGSGGAAGAAGDSSIFWAGGASSCSFEYLGDEVLCQGAASRTQDDDHEHFATAEDLEDCAAECAEREDCTAIVDYFEPESLPVCYLSETPCDDPVQPVWAEEDAGKAYKKVCDGDNCNLEYLGNWQRCSESETLVELAGAKNFEDCEQACLEDPDCTSVTDYFWIATIQGCYLYSGACEEQRRAPPGDPARVYEKLCDL